MYLLSLFLCGPLISAVKQMWGLCSSPPTPPPSPHAIKLFKCLCFSVRLWVLSVCLLRVCVFMFLTVCCRHLEPSKKRNIVEVCFGKSKRKLTAEGGGKLECCYFSSLFSGFTEFQQRYIFQIFPQLFFLDNLTSSVVFNKNDPDKIS